MILFKEIKIQLWVILSLIWTSIPAFIKGVEYIVHDVTWLINWFT